MSNGSSTGTELLAMPAKRFSVKAFNRAKASAGVPVPRSDKLAAAASQFTSLSVTMGLSISLANAGALMSSARVTKTARFSKQVLARPASRAPDDSRPGS